MLKKLLLLSLAVLPLLACRALITAGDREERVLDERLRLLRSGDGPEWSEFAELSFQKTLNLEFEAGSPAPRSLRFRQYDVRGDWKLLLNGRSIGVLAGIESDTLAYWPLPSDLLVEGTNRLEIVPGGKRADDILVGDLRVYAETVDELLSQARVSVRIRDAESGRPLPSRLTLVDVRGALVPFKPEPPGPLAVSPGMAYTADGHASISLQAGRYTLYASRGFEYGIASLELELQAGTHVEHEFRLTREVETAGYVAADTHLHTLTYSGHGDASVDDRVLSIAGEGIELAVATEHNVSVDYAEAARRLGLAGLFTAVSGAELTTPVGHFSIFPVRQGAMLPGVEAGNWPVLFQAIRETPDIQVVFLNHPRDRHGDYRPFGPSHLDPPNGENAHGWPFEAHGMEVVNSGALQSDPLLLFRDWFALLNQGLRVTPVGSSDSHDVGRLLAGQARTYVACDDADPGGIDPECVFRSFRQGRVLVSMGLLTEIRVNDRFGPGDLAAAAGQEIQVSVRVSGPSWTSVDRILLFANGQPVREINLPSREASPGGLKWESEWRLPRPEHDLHLVAVALGPGVTAPFWRIPKPYQPSTPDWTPYVIGSTGPVWLDADSDGRYTSTRKTD